MSWNDTKTGRPCAVAVAYDPILFLNTGSRKVTQLAVRHRRVGNRSTMLCRGAVRHLSSVLSSSRCGAEGRAWFPTARRPRSTVLRSRRTDRLREPPSNRVVRPRRPPAILTRRAVETHEDLDGCITQVQRRLVIPSDMLAGDRCGCGARRREKVGESDRARRRESAALRISKGCAAVLSAAARGGRRARPIESLLSALRQAKERRAILASGDVQANRMQRA